MKTIGSETRRKNKLEEKKKMLDEIKKEFGENYTKAENNYTLARTNYNSMFCHMLIEHMSHGFDFSTFSTKINVSPKTLYNWLRDYPDFANAYEIAKSSQQFFYQKLCIKNARKNVGNSNMCIFLAKNKLGYTDKQEINTTNRDIVITTSIGVDGVITKQLDENETKRLIGDALDIDFNETNLEQETIE